MKEQLRALYELQAIDAKIARANTQIAALTGAKELRVKYSTAKAALQKAEKTLSTYESEVRDNELQLKSIDEKRRNFEKRLYSGAISNPKELSATEKEIEMLKGRQSELDGRTLELYELVETAKQEVESLGKTVQTVEAEARKAIKQESQLKTRLESEISELSARREAAVSNITDRSLLSKYDSIRKHNASTGIAKVDDGRCEGCHVAITSYTISNLYKDNEIQTCENCGRILFMDVE